MALASSRDGRLSDPPIEVVFQCEVLRDEDRLTVFLDHVEVVRGVHTPLEQDPVQRSGWRCVRRYVHVRVGCIFEEFCDEVGRALEGDGLAGGCLRCCHGRVCKTSRARVGREGHHVEVSYIAVAGALMVPGVPQVHHCDNFIVQRRFSLKHVLRKVRPCSRRK